MFKEFIQSLKQFAEIGDSDLDKIISAIKVRQVKKKKNILSAGDPASNMFYLNEGLVRYYVYDKSGVEQTTDIVVQHNWCGDTGAFIQQTEATITVEAIEDSEVFCLHRSDIDKFYDEIPGFERLNRKILEHYLIKALTKARALGRTGKTAQEKYLEFQKAHPQLEGRVPAIYLASFLGLAPETISRLRHQKLK